MKMKPSTLLTIYYITLQEEQQRILLRISLFINKNNKKNRLWKTKVNKKGVSYPLVEILDQTHTQKKKRKR